MTKKQQDDLIKNRQDILTAAWKTGNPFYIGMCVTVFFWADVLYPLQKIPNRAPAE